VTRKTEQVQGKVSGHNLLIIRDFFKVSGPRNRPDSRARFEACSVRKSYLS
jgi:hypothetical protein